MERDLWGGLVLLGVFLLIPLGWPGWLPRGVLDLLAPEEPWHDDD